MSLPSGYTLLEYIESTGAQYIDTGFYPNGHTRVIADCNLISGTYPTAFGAWTDGSTDKYILLALSSTQIRSYYNTTETDATIGILGRHTLDMNGGTVAVDGIEYVSVANSSFSCQKTMYLFTFHGGETMSAFQTSARYYSCKIYDNGSIVRNFIPCKNASGTVGMWDDVNSAFYGNAGSGSFGAGPELTAPDTPAGVEQLCAVTLRWSAMDCDGYRIYRDSVLLAETSQTTYTDTTAAEDSQYTYSVSAYRGSLESTAVKLQVYTKSGYFVIRPVISSAFFQ